MSILEFIGKGLQFFGIIKSGAKELPLNGKSFYQYKGDLMRQRAHCERQLWNDWKYKTEIKIDREKVLSEIKEINTLLKSVYKYEFSRKVFPL